MTDLAKRYRRWTLGAGIASLGMGGFHVFLPKAFGWGPYVDTLPAAIHWGVYSINFFMSVLIIMGALLSLRIRIDSGDAATLVPFGMGLFWTINGAYQIVIPFPMPSSMQALRWSLLAFPLVVAACYFKAWTAARRYRRDISER